MTIAVGQRLEQMLSANRIMAGGPVGLRHRER